MNLLEILNKGHSKAIRDRIITQIDGNPILFKQLIKLFLDGPYRITQRAAWPLSIIVQQHPQLVKPFLKSIILNLNKPEVTDAVKRNTMRLLQYTDIPPSLDGIITERCFIYLSDKKEAVAVRVFAMTVLTKLAERHPPLKKELIVIIEDELPYAKPAFLSRAKRNLKQLKA